MNKLLLLVVSLLLAIIPSYSQPLSEAELNSTMHRAFELHEAKQYSEALEAFLFVGANVDVSKSEDARQIYVCSQTMACSCYFQMEQYSEGYNLAGKLIREGVTDMENEDVFAQYVHNGYMEARGLLRRDGSGEAEYEQARGILYEIYTYAEDDLKVKILVEIPLSWYYEGALHFEDLRFNESLSCSQNALNGFVDLDMPYAAMSVLNLIAYIQYTTDQLDKAIDSYEHMLSLACQVGDDGGRMEAVIQLRRLNAIIGDMEGVALYDGQMESIIAESQDKQVQFDYYTQKGHEAHKLGYLKIAEQWLLQSKTIAESEDSDVASVGKYTIYSKLADLYKDAERYDDALLYAKLALEEARELHPVAGKEYYLNFLQLARIQSASGDNESCLNSLDSLFMIEPYISEPRERSHLYVTRGGCRADLQDYNSALADYKKAEEILSSAYPDIDSDRVML